MAPIQELGSDTIWFYPDFLLWANQNEVWAIDPKGKHLLESAVTHKLLDLGSLKNIAPSIRVGFVLEGSYTVDQQGVFSRSGREGFTLVRKPGTKPKALHFRSLTALVKELL
jgi:hypothetical protein